MKRSLFVALLFLFAVTSARPDGTVTTPANIAPASWKIASLNMSNGAGNDVAGASITVYYFDAGGVNIVQTSIILLTGAELTSFLTTIESPVGGETGTAAKKFRQRVTSWLVANGKITNVTPE